MLFSFLLSPKFTSQHSILKHCCISSTLFSLHLFILSFTSMCLWSQFLLSCCSLTIFGKHNSSHSLLLNYSFEQVFPFKSSFSFCQNHLFYNVRRIWVLMAKIKQIIAQGIHLKSNTDFEFVFLKISGCYSIFITLCKYRLFNRILLAESYLIGILAHTMSKLGIQCNIIELMGYYA